MVSGPGPGGVGCIDVGQITMRIPRSVSALYRREAFRLSVISIEIEQVKIWGFISICTSIKNLKKCRRLHSYVFFLAHDLINYLHRTDVQALNGKQRNHYSRFPWP